MIRVPNNERDRLALANELVELCRVSVGARMAYYRLMNSITETGRYDGTKSLINMMYRHLTRVSDHIFSPVELKFTLGYGRPKLKDAYEKASIVAKELTQTWENSNTDMTFGRGVFESLKYGASLLKQWPQMVPAEGHEDGLPQYYDKLVMPWQFGVFREDENRLDRQEAMCETVSLTMPEVWQRIWHFENAKKLFDKIKAHSQSGAIANDPQSYFHQVLSASQINTSVQASSAPGGIVQIGNDPNFSVMGPVIAAPVVQMHEIWVKDEDDYCTMQLIEPDILIAPLHKKSNLLGVKAMHPYTLIQPNEVTNWFWGRSELVDLIEPQGLLSTWCDDAKRLMGVQIDKILGFVGDTGMTDESYGMFRQAGYANLPPGSDIKDITPKFPPEMLPMIKWCIEIINTLGEFPEIMQGKGEAGVRAGVHANTLLKTASPSLRDRSLLVERQCATAGDKTLSLMEAKDEQFYWIKADKIEDVENTKFLISQLPPDWRVGIDSHSSSPIFVDENSQLIFQAAKLGYVTGEYVIDNMPFPNKEMAKVQLREKETKQAQFMQEILKNNPDLGNKLLEKQAMGKR